MELKDENLDHLTMINDLIEQINKIDELLEIHRKYSAHPVETKQIYALRAEFENALDDPTSAEKADTMLSKRKLFDKLAGSWSDVDDSIERIIYESRTTSDRGQFDL